MPNDPRARIFMPLSEFDKSIQNLSSSEKRLARIEFVSDGISLYNYEKRWTHRLKPHRILWYINPLHWLYLWYRNAFSKMTLSVICKAINECRDRWPDALEDCDLSFRSIKDPLNNHDNV